VPQDRALAVEYAGPMSVPVPDHAGDAPAADHATDTPALRAIAASGRAFTVVRTVPARNPEESAALQGIELGSLLRTIVVRRGADDYLFVLVPAGRRIDWPRLRAHLGVSRLSLPDLDEAKAVTGYERGAITPFGASRAWPVIADATLAILDLVAIGGGARGVNLHLRAADLVAWLDAALVDISEPEPPPG
jgi:Cys-tRNA(Pro)/Cys-tRNA(Cys) deacylase